MKLALEQELERNTMLLKDAERSLEFERQQKEILEKERWEILKEAGVQIPGNQKLEGYFIITVITKFKFKVICVILHIKQKNKSDNINLKQNTTYI